MDRKRTNFRPDISGVDILDVYLKDDTYIVDAVRIDNRLTCCDKKVHLHEYVNVTIKDIAYNDKPVVIKVKKQRYKCSNCGKRYTSQLDFVEKNCYISTNIKQKLVRGFSKVTNLTELARENHISIHTVFTEFDKLIIEPKSKAITRLFMDEFRGNADGNKYQLIVYDQDHEVVALLPTRQNTDLIPFLEKMNREHDIEYVIMDMFQPFRYAVQQCIPNAKIIADTFHFVRQMLWAIRDTRLRLYANHTNFKELKRHKYLLNKRYSKLTPKEIKTMTKLRQLENLKDPYHAYEFNDLILLKYDFDDILDNSKIDRNPNNIKAEFDRLISMLTKRSSTDEMKKVGRTFKNWYDEILLSFCTGLNNGFVEGKNNKIKVIKRICYGIQRFDRYEKHIFLKI